MTSIGIDIGTSNTVVAKVDANGNITVHKFEDDDLLPSMIHVEETGGNITAGKAAREFWSGSEDNPGETFRRWKMSMADNIVLATQDWGGGPVDISPEKLTTWLVEHIMKQITGGLGGESVDSVVVTVPHGWRREHAEKCLATRKAAREAEADGRPLGATVRDQTVDEPVAAAVYALYAAGNTADFAGKDLLIVDIGGGTTDLSLVRVGGPDDPLVVIDAVNNNIGGDYATSLLLLKHLENIATRTGITVPNTAEAVLRSLEHSDSTWLRAAFAAAEDQLLHTISRYAKIAEGRGNLTDKISGDWGGRRVPVSSMTDNGTIMTEMSRAEYFTCLEPFFRSTQKLLTAFLRNRPSLPYAILMTGGGSNIGGLRTMVIEPTLRRLATPSEAREVLERLKKFHLNESKLSTAVAMGAALVASGRMTIEERLLFDIGLEVTISEKMAKELDLGESRQCIVSPLLKSGSRLPATVSLKDLGFGTVDIQEDDLEQRAIIFDDITSPYEQVWSWSRSTLTSRNVLKNVDVRLTADTEGVLKFIVTAHDGNNLINIDGRLSRPNHLTRSRAGTIYLHEDQVQSKYAVRTPDQIAKARTAAS